MGINSKGLLPHCPHPGIVWHPVCSEANEGGANAMRRLYVPIADADLRQLVERAALRRRRPQDEAAIILQRALGSNQPTDVEGVRGAIAAVPPNPVAER
jgi:hypothetical protein